MSDTYHKDPQAISQLTPEQYQVTQKKGTEPAFRNEYWDNHEQGIYVDIVSGEPLFASINKFESGSGWPSFWQPMQGAVGTSSDGSHFMTRTEVHCAKCGGHLGHVFPDGPKPTGERYCMNGAALKFDEKK